MNLDELTAISPIDGRYRSKTNEFAPFLSEFGLIRYRLLVEIEYFIALCRLPLPQLKEFDHELFKNLKEIYTQFTLEEASEIKEIEKTTNHDVKAVEYFIKKRFEALKLDKYKEFIHFGLTSQDINNTAIPYAIKEALKEVFYPTLDKVVENLTHLSVEWKDTTMLARTHGQPASPTRLGKEIAVFVERLAIQISQVKQIPYSAKFGGATGNFNAHQVTYPYINWVEFGNQFVNHILVLERSLTTTQIEHYDNMAGLLDGLKRINTILVDLCRDVWTYISLEYFKQKIKKGEIGSSAMPHKVNPIDFENAEGNLGVANALYEHLSAKLPVSRLQRDLSDSTVLRNVGVPLAHTLIALKSILKGLDKLVINIEAINKDLDSNWPVVGEAIQSILRREGYPNPYEALLELTRKHEKINQASLYDFIDTLDVNDKVKTELKNITPFNYTGI